MTSIKHLCEPLTIIITRRKTSLVFGHYLARIEWYVMRHSDNKKHPDVSRNQHERILYGVL